MTNKLERLEKAIDRFIEIHDLFMVTWMIVIVLLSLTVFIIWIFPFALTRPVIGLLVGAPLAFYIIFKIRGC